MKVHLFSSILFMIVTFCYIMRVAIFMTSIHNENPNVFSYWSLKIKQAMVVVVFGLWMYALIMVFVGKMQGTWSFHSDTNINIG